MIAAAIAALPLQCHGGPPNGPVEDTQLMIDGATAHVVGTDDQAIANGFNVTALDSGVYRLMAVTTHTPEFQIWADLIPAAGGSYTYRQYSRPYGAQGPIQLASVATCTKTEGKTPA